MNIKSECVRSVVHRLKENKLVEIAMEDIYHRTACSINLTTVTSNFSTSSFSDKIFFVTLITILGVFIAFGNGLVITSYFTNKHLRQPHFNIYIVNLAVADLFIGILAVPTNIFIVINDYQVAMVSPAFYLQTLSASCAYVSIYTQIAMSYDRYILVTDALKYRKQTSKRKAKSLVMFSWIYCITTSSITSASYHVFWMLPISCFKFPLHDIAGIVFFVHNYLLPLTILSALNLTIFIKLRIRSKMFRRKAAIPSISRFIIICKGTNVAVKEPMAGGEDLGIPDTWEKSEIKTREENEDILMPPSSLSTAVNSTLQRSSEEVTDVKAGTTENNTPQESLTSRVTAFHPREQLNKKKTINMRTNESESIRLKRLRKAGRQLLLIVLTFLICWCPFQIFVLVSSNNSDVEGINVHWFTSLVIVFYCNSLINPVLYILTCRLFKRQVKKLIFILLCSAGV